MAAERRRRKNQGMTAEYAVEQWCSDTSAPQQGAGEALLTTAKVLAAVSRGTLQ